MSVAAQVLIAPQTGAKTSGQLIRSSSDGPCTIVAAGLAGAETVSVQILAADGATFVAVTASPAVQLTSSINTVVLSGPGIYQFVKSATAGSVGVVAYSI